MSEQDDRIYEAERAFEIAEETSVRMARDAEIAHAMSVALLKLGPSASYQEVNAAMALAIADVRQRHAAEAKATALKARAELALARALGRATP